ncbi:MAG: intradiol ring-cleavage dioxygenase [Anaerolineae bacterium]|nr:intradiol ring-cleavage dioxygenase [Anaerolineae bacterium]
MSDNDDEPVGRILSRREVLKLLGAASAALLVGCGPEQTTAVPTSVTTASQTAANGVTAVAPTVVVPTAAPVVDTPIATLVSATAVPVCVARPELTEGPYFVDTGLQRADIRSDPATGVVKDGVLLMLIFNVSQINNGCTPLPGALVDVWHCDALGVYSGVTDRSFDTSGQQFLRGYQVTDANGAAKFVTIYPGWYPGRAVHIHFKIRTDPNAAQGYEFTSQLFFDEALNDQVHAQPPYASKGRRNTLNSNDRIFHEQLVVTAVPDDNGYTATFDVGLDLSA